MLFVCNTRKRDLFYIIQKCAFSYFLFCNSLSI